MKKIVVTGPHCCGKSTVIKKIEKDIEIKTNIKFVHFSGKDSPVDYSNAQKLKNNVNFEIDITYYMIGKLIEREINLEYTGEENIAVLDRCLIDQMVYPSVLLDEKYLNNIFEYIRLWLDIHPYIHIFYIPKNYELLEKFGTKDKSKEYLDLIEDKYLEILKKLNIEYTILPSIQDEQVRIIKKYLIDNKIQGD